MTNPLRPIDRAHDDAVTLQGLVQAAAILLNEINTGANREAGALHSAVRAMEEKADALSVALGDLCDGRTEGAAS